MMLGCSEGGCGYVTEFRSGASHELYFRLHRFDTCYELVCIAPDNDLIRSLNGSTDPVSGMGSNREALAPAPNSTAVNRGSHSPPCFRLIQRTGYYGVL